MKRTSVMVAVAGFFALAIVGWLSGVSPLTCGVRAVIGGAVLYVVAKIASRIVLGIMADAILRGSLQRKDLTNHVGEDRQ